MATIKTSEAINKVATKVKDGVIPALNLKAKKDLTNVNVGSANAGKTFKVKADGTLEMVSIPTGSGGDFADKDLANLTNTGKSQLWQRVDSNTASFEILKFNKSMDVIVYDNGNSIINLRNGNAIVASYVTSKAADGTWSSSVRDRGSPLNINDSTSIVTDKIVADYIASQLSEEITITDINGVQHTILVKKKA